MNIMSSEIRLVQVRSGCVRLSEYLMLCQVRSGYFRLGEVMLGYFILLQVVMISQFRGVYIT